MPKLKTHNGAAKRFKKTATGKVKRAAFAPAPHPDVEGHRSVKSKLATAVLVSDADTPKVMRMIPY